MVFVTSIRRPKTDRLVPMESSKQRLEQISVPLSWQVLGFCAIYNLKIEAVNQLMASDA